MEQVQKDGAQLTYLKNSKDASDWSKSFTQEAVKGKREWGQIKLNHG